MTDSDKAVVERVQHAIDTSCGKSMKHVRVTDLIALLAMVEEQEALLDEAAGVLQEIANWKRVHEHTEFGAGYNVAAEDIGEAARATLARIKSMEK